MENRKKTKQTVLPEIGLIQTEAAKFQGEPSFRVNRIATFQYQL